MLTECKLAVLEAAFGIKSLEERELLARLEDLYLKGVAAGARAQLPPSLRKVEA